MAHPVSYPRVPLSLETQRLGVKHTTHHKLMPRSRKCGYPRPHTSLWGSVYPSPPVSPIPGSMSLDFPSMVDAFFPERLYNHYQGLPSHFFPRYAQNLMPFLCRIRPGFALGQVCTEAGTVLRTVALGFFFSCLKGRKKSSHQPTCAKFCALTTR
jgi:hypothetical protein